MSTSLNVTKDVRTSNEAVDIPSLANITLDERLDLEASGELLDPSTQRRTGLPCAGERLRGRTGTKGDESSVWQGLNTPTSSCLPEILAIPG